MMTMTTMMKTTVRFGKRLGFCEYFNSFAEIFKGSNLPSFCVFVFMLIFVQNQHFFDNFSS